MAVSSRNTKREAQRHISCKTSMMEPFLQKWIRAFSCYRAYFNLLLHAVLARSALFEK